MRVPCNRSLLAPRRATAAGCRSRLRLPGLNVGSTTSVRSAPRARGMNRRSEPPERSADRVRRACGDEPFRSCSGCCVRILFPAPEISEPSASGHALSIATVRLKARGSCTRHRTCRPSLGVSGVYQTQGGPSQQPGNGVCIFHLSSPPLVMKGHLHERHPIIPSRVARCRLSGGHPSWPAAIPGTCEEKGSQPPHGSPDQGRALRKVSVDVPPTATSFSQTANFRLCGVAM